MLFRSLSIEVVQALVLGAVALGLSWEPTIRIGVLLAAVLLGTAAFAGLGLLLAGRLSGPANLAAANGLYLVLLLLGGVAVPAGELPGAIGGVVGVLPSGALVDAMRAATTDGLGAARPLGVLAVWAVAMPLAAVVTFRWAPSD